MSVNRAKLSGTVTWSNGDLFNGFALFILQPPTASSIPWPQIWSQSTNTPTEIPLRTPIPINNGQFNNQAELIQNDSIDPPNTRYTVYYYDNTRKLVGSVTTPFAVNTNPYTPSVPTLTVPVAPVTPTNFPET